MTGYKATDKNMKCKGYEFELNKEYNEKKVELCSKGFHFCENPLDILNYYDLCDSKFFEIEAKGVSSETRNDDTKRVSKSIKLKTEIGIAGLVKAGFEYLWNECFEKGNTEDEASDEDYSKLASSGYNSKLASSGNNSKLASSGNNSKLASSGNYSKLASSGYNSKLASSGDYSQLASSGQGSKVSQEEGIENVVCNVGIDGIARGKKGSILILAEYERLDLPHLSYYVYKPICVKTVKIDGKKIKEDTFYKLENRKFIEVESDKVKGDE